MKIIRVISLIMIAGVLSIATACHNKLSSADIENSIRQAEQYLAIGDMEAAYSAISHLENPKAPISLSATQMARLSMVYMQIDDTIGSDHNTELATDYYDRAYKQSADSAEAFYRTVSPDQMQHVAAMAARSWSRNNTVDISSLPDEHEHTNLDIENVPQ